MDESGDAGGLFSGAPRIPPAVDQQAEMHQNVNDLRQECVDILEGTDNTQPISPEQRRRLNEKISASIRTRFDRMRDNLIKKVTIQEGDTPEMASAKLHSADEATGFISGLSAWITEKIEYIINIARRSWEWCKEKTKSLFDYLGSLFR